MTEFINFKITIKTTEQTGYHRVMTGNSPVETKKTQ